MIIGKNNNYCMSNHFLSLAKFKTKEKRMCGLIKYIELLDSWYLQSFQSQFLRGNKILDNIWEL